MRHLLICFLLITLASCGKPQPAVQNLPPVRVAATAYVTVDIARQIGGSDVVGVWILEKPSTLESFTPSPQDRQQVRSADLLVVSGSLDAWALEDFDTRRVEAGIVRLNTLPGVTDSAGAALWLDPKVALAFVDEIANQLRIRRPRHQQRFMDAAASYKEAIAAVQRESESALSRVAGKKIGTLSPAYDALLMSYQLVPVRLDDTPPHQLTDDQLFELKQSAKQAGVEALALDASLPDSLVQLIQSKTGLKVLQIETVGSSSTGNQACSYIDLCRHNLQELCKLTSN